MRENDEKVIAKALMAAQARGLSVAVRKSGRESSSEATAMGKRP